MVVITGEIHHVRALFFRFRSPSPRSLLVNDGAVGRRRGGAERCQKGAPSARPAPLRPLGLQSVAAGMRGERPAVRLPQQFGSSGGLSSSMTLWQGFVACE